MDTVPGLLAVHDLAARVLGHAPLAPGDRLVGLGPRAPHPELARGHQHHLGAVLALGDLRRTQRIDVDGDVRVCLYLWTLAAGMPGA